MSWQLVILSLIAYLAVTIPGNKSPYLGIIFDAYIACMIALTLAWLLTIASRRSRQLAYAIVGVSLAFAVATYRLPWMQLHGISFSPHSAALRKELNSQVVEFLLTDSNLDRRIICVPAITSYINGDAIIFASLQVGRILRPIAPSYIDDDLDRHVRDIADADYVILVSANYRDLLRWTPSAKIVTKIADAIEHDDRFEIGRVITSELGDVRIFLRK